MSIRWQASMETGAPLLDARRRELVERADRLLSAVEAGGKWSVVERALRDFGDYSVRHFSQEEECQMRGACPALQWNGAARADLISIIGDFRRSFESAGASPELAENLTCRLAEWVALYIPGPSATELPCVTQSR